MQDILTSLAYLRFRRDITDTIDLAGFGEAGVWCMLASAIDGDVRNTLVDAAGFDPDDDNSWVQKHYVPCILAVGGLDTAAALIAPRKLTVTNAVPSFSDGVEQMYKAAQASTVQVLEGQLDCAGLLEALK